jgi:hypothetical protein
MPHDVPLKDGERYRAILSTIPEDLLDPGDVSVSFQTGNRFDRIAHRVRKAQPVTYVVALIGLMTGAIYFIKLKS